VQGIGWNGSGKQQAAAARRMNTDKASNGRVPFLFQLSTSSWLPTYSKTHIHFTDTYTIYPRVHHIHPTSIMTNGYFVQLNYHNIQQSQLRFCSIYLDLI